MQLTILKLSEGDIEKLHELIHITNVGFRNVLYWVEYLHKDSDEQ